MPVLLALVGYAVAEVAAAVAVAAWIGVGWMFLALFGISLLGTVLLRREGTRAWRSFSTAVNEGRPPGREALDGVLVLIGALLIILPGFVTDVLGLLCLLPPTRRLIGRVFLGWALHRGRATVARVQATRGPAGSVPPGYGPPGPVPPDRGSAPPPSRGRVIEGEIEPPPDPPRP